MRPIVVVFLLPLLAACGNEPFLVGTSSPTRTPRILSLVQANMSTTTPPATTAIPAAPLVSPTAMLVPSATSVPPNGALHVPAMVVPTATPSSTPQPHEYAPNEVIVAYVRNINITDQEKDDIRRSVNAKLKKRIDRLDADVFIVPDGKEFETIEKLQKHPKVEFATLNHYMRLGD